MPSNYLYLDATQRVRSGVTSIAPRWSNLPTISTSTRECYLTVIDCSVHFSAQPTFNAMNVKMKIPSRNYFSSDNEDVLVAFLEVRVDELGGKQYTLPKGNEISILTNDNLKDIQFTIEDPSTETPVVLGQNDNMHVMLKLDYVDQKAMTQTYMEELPQHLTGGR